MSWALKGVVTGPWIGMKKKNDFVVPLTPGENKDLMEHCVRMTSEERHHRLPEHEIFFMMYIALLLQENFPDVPMQHCEDIRRTLIIQGCIVQDTVEGWKRISWGDLEYDYKISKWWIKLMRDDR
mmetsp:Transcript_16293/g.21317  ORF Transcript_16293/g.21317 Transcript_16293/m.21317 type:complete len:125 (+) Transcript_16293:137-511(+)|eukprot:CAMPEP_0198153080 /NCGR_PEP_ID=MMETSP1443-20131203/62615_1 /TAXON_ID=186043 /ORGANISM="Entomoneis sp., Strain CCMP2396" /LENGTH=124 /DNA_ID=CAMNT_0043819297 /DNA_START=95 /DNA_END=469 /DNA_ORIENTATION=-